MTIDEFWLTDPMNESTMASARFSVDENFDSEFMQNYWKKNFCEKINGARSKLIQVFGKNYIVRMSDEELEKAWPKVCIKLEGRFTEE